MKRTTITLIFIVACCMFLPTQQIMLNIPNLESDIHGITVIDEPAMHAVIPTSNMHVIRVNDDVFTIDGDPSTNYGSYTTYGGLLVGNDSAGNVGRIWMKFDLSHIPSNVRFTRAFLNLFQVHSFTAADEPIGLYYSDNNTWDQDTITWNNEPNFDNVPIDIIDSPSSPDMFVMGNWYKWEVTNKILQTLSEGDGMITLVIKQIDENRSTNSMIGFSSLENSMSSGWNSIPNIALEYSIPITNDLQVDGYSELPQIDYINNENPEFNFAFNDEDSGDMQKNYELEVWDSASFDETKLMNKNNSKITTVHYTAGVGISGPDTFNAPVIWRCQYKWPGSMITQSGVVDKLFFEVDASTGITTYTDLAIYIQCVDNSSDLDYDYELNYDGRTPIQVLNQSEYTAITKDGYIEFDIENTFTVCSGLSLIIEIKHTGASGTSVQGNFTDSGGSFAARSGSFAYSFSTAGTKNNVITQGLKLELVSQEILSNGENSNAIPFGVGIETDTTYRIQYKYDQSLFETSGTVDILRFPVTGFGDATYKKFSVYLVETEVKGRLDETDMNRNYGEQLPVLVLNSDEYTVKNIGKMLVIDVDDIFFYTNTNDLLIELRFDSRTSGSESVKFDYGRGAYRAIETSSFSTNDTVGPDLLVDFIYNTSTVTYTGTSLVNATTYYWRVRTCDSLGIWSLWKSSSFKYEFLETSPEWINLVETASPIELGESMTLSIDVTHTTGMEQVQLEFGGVNHTMMKLGDSFSYTWTPDSAEDTIPYTMYMEPFSGVYGVISDSIGVVDTKAPTWVYTPADKVLIFGESLSHQLLATDLSGIAEWTINDNANFIITDGLVTNRTTLAPGGYFLSVTVADNEGNILSGTFIVAVLEPTEPTTTITTTTEPIDTDTTTSGIHSEEPTSSEPPTASTPSSFLAAILGIISFSSLVLLKRRKG